MSIISRFLLIRISPNGTSSLYTVKSVVAENGSIILGGDTTGTLGTTNDDFSDSVAITLDADGTSCVEMAGEKEATRRHSETGHGPGMILIAHCTSFLRREQ